MQSDIPLRYDLPREANQFRNFRGWLREIGFSDEEIRRRLKAENGVIPTDIADRLRAFLASRVDDNCLLLLKKLQSDSNGIPIEKFGFSRKDIYEVIREGDCACSVLRKLLLIRIQDRELFKPRPISFDWRVLNLLGS